MRVREWAWLRTDFDAISSARLATPPTRSAALAAATILATVGVYAGGGLLAGGFERMPVWTVAVLCALVLVALPQPEPYPLHVASLCALAAGASVTRGFGFPPFPLLAALCAYAVVLLASPRLRESLDWAHSGAWVPGSRRLALLTAALPLVGLPLWRAVSLPDLGPAVRVVAGIPFWALPFIGLFFALVNAITQEIAFRGVLFDALMSAVGVPAALVLQAVAFGFAHIDALPGGPLGVALSGLYGLVLGVIRLRARGMVAPCAAHALANVVQFGWLVVWAH